MTGNPGIDHKSLAEAAFRKVLPGVCAAIRCTLEREPSGGQSHFFRIEASCTDGSIFWGGAEISANGTRVEARIVMFKKQGETALFNGEEYKDRF
jgi:hypothetical protein